MGNHTSYLDPLLVGSSTNKCVHFFSKDSLYKGIKKPIFKGLGIIPVNRKIKDKNALGGVVNVFAVGTSLLCGSFVPVEFLPDIVLTIGHIFPSYYYINSNNIAKEMEIFNFNSFSPILINYLVLFIFTIIFIILSIVVIKKNRQTRG